MTTIEEVWSPIKDDKFKTNLENSEVWKNAYKPEEVTYDVRGKYPKWYAYRVKFINTTPIHCMKIKEIQYQYNFGKTFSKEHKDKMSKSHSNKSAWSKGKNISKEHRNNISKGLKQFHKNKYES